MLKIVVSQGDQMTWEKSPNIFWKVAKTVANPNKAKIQTVFLNSLFSWKCNKLVAKGVTNFWAISLFQKIQMSLQKVA